MKLESEYDAMQNNNGACQWVYRKSSHTHGDILEGRQPIIRR